MLFRLLQLLISRCSFRLAVFFARAKQPGAHQIRLSVANKDVPINRFNPEQREMFIPTVPAKGRYREALKIGYAYRLKVVALGLNNERMDESLWSSPEVILPPRPLCQVPIMFLTRVMPSGMSSLPMFVRQP